MNQLGDEPPRDTGNPACRPAQGQEEPPTDPAPVATPDRAVDNSLETYLKDRLREGKTYHVLRRIANRGSGTVFEVFRALALIAEDEVERIRTRRQLEVDQSPASGETALLRRLQAQLRGWETIAEHLRQVRDLSGGLYLDDTE